MPLRLSKNKKRFSLLSWDRGGGKSKLIEQVEALNLTNVRFFPLQPYEKLSALLATADVHLVLQKKAASDLVLPSKLTSILSAAGCAVITAVPDTTLYTMVEKHEMGILIEPESALALVEGITYALTCDRSVYQKNGRAYAEMYLSKDAILKDFESFCLSFRKQKTYVVSTQELIPVSAEI
ncbi:glycosyltransferase [Siphonobacter sp. BAB-5405]|uniref:glycosyltransferase n=1 Tax=Siphonobacter sp. BAB-5405 TaxID=1864825 RepID=UPI001E53D93F|nr:glycosyltransferase [Siphonobacter sp. BAB-5405]